MSNRPLSLIVMALGFVAAITGLAIGLYYGIHEFAAIFGIGLLFLAYATAMANQWTTDPTERVDG